MKTILQLAQSWSSSLGHDIPQINGSAENIRELVAVGRTHVGRGSFELGEEGCCVGCLCCDW